MPLDDNRLGTSEDDGSRLDTNCYHHKYLNLNINIILTLNKTKKTHKKNKQTNKLKKRVISFRTRTVKVYKTRLPLVRQPTVLNVNSLQASWFSLPFIVHHVIMKLLPSSSRPRPFWVMETSQYPRSYLSLCRLVESPLQPLKNLNCAVYLKGPHLVFWLVESGQLMIYCYTTGVCKGRWWCRSVQCTWREYKRIQRAGLIE